MNNAIYPCLWFDGKAKEAAEFYCSIFGNSKIVVESSMVVQFEIEGKKILINTGMHLRKMEKKACVDG